MPSKWTRENVRSATEMQQVQMDWVLATHLFANQDLAEGYNRELTAKYSNVFDQYSKVMDNHPELNPIPPIPDFKWIVEEVTPGGWSQLCQSKELVCQPLLYIPTKKPNLSKWKIGGRYYPGNDTYFYVLDGDITPNNEENEGTSSDGVKGTFKKYAYIQSSPGAHDIPGVFIKIK